MLEFQKFLKENNRIEDRGYRDFRRIKIGTEYSLSIQGSARHHSTPKTAVEPNKYIAMELVVLKNTKIVSILRDKVVRAYPRFDELKSYCGGEQGRTLCDVPVELIQDFFKYMQNKDVYIAQYNEQQEEE